jgi:soluble P-type ATPase
MAMENYTRYQQGVIKRFYEHKDSIQLQRLSELVAEIYLAEGKKQAKLWASASTLMEKLGVPPARVQKLLAQAKPELLANLVKELQGG